MEIKTITRYKFDGVEYENLNAVKTKVENRIGAIIDKLCNPPLTSKQRLQIFEVIAKKHVELSKLLNVTFTIEGPTFNSAEDKNILDL